MTEQAKFVPQKERGLSIKQKLARTGVAAMTLAVAKFGADRIGDQPVYAEGAGAVTVLPVCAPDYDAKRGEVVRFSSPGIMSSTITGDVLVRNSVVEGKNHRVKYDNDSSTGMIVISTTGTTVESPFGSDILPCVANNKDQSGKNKIQRDAEEQIMMQLQNDTSELVYQETGKDSRGRKIYNEQHIRHVNQLKWVIPQGK